MPRRKQDPPTLSLDTDGDAIRTNVILPRAMHGAAAQLAKKENTTIADIIRKLLADYLGNPDLAHTRKRGYQQPQKSA